MTRFYICDRCGITGKARKELLTDDSWLLPSGWQKTPNTDKDEREHDFERVALMVDSGIPEKQAVVDATNCGTVVARCKTCVRGTR